MELLVLLPPRPSPSCSGFGSGIVIAKGHVWSDCLTHGCTECRNPACVRVTAHRDRRHLQGWVM